LASLLEVLPVGAFTLGPGQKILTMNPAAGRLVGLDITEVLGRSCEEVLQCSFCGPACATCHARENGQVQRAFPSEIQRGDGTRRSVLIDAVPLEDGIVTVLIRDVTETERLRRALQDRWVFHGLVCVSPIMKEIVGKIRDVAPYDSTVLVLGESGTGKELVAHALHAESHRAERPFVTVNCSAYSENLLESELFGHVRGSYTGAERDRRGRFELADGGTIFLDEIGEISPKVQVKLLRVLQEREIERVGDSTTRSVDLRILAATNRDLAREVHEGRFREDLYYRLNVFALQLPPLRERKADIAALTDFLIQKVAKRTGKTVTAISEEAMEVFLCHAWPGNVRELENVIESAVVRARGDILLAVDLPDVLTDDHGRPARREDRIQDALRRTAGCVTRAARLLGIHRTTLWRHMREAGLRREDFF
jgi:PAS domain S-box-containing protein